jgi:hypothetical protein
MHPPTDVPEPEVEQKTNRKRNSSSASKAVPAKRKKAETKKAFSQAAKEQETALPLPTEMPASTAGIPANDMTGGDSEPGNSLEGHSAAAADAVVVVDKGHPPTSRSSPAKPSTPGARTMAPAAERKKSGKNGRILIILEDFDLF